MPARTFSFSFRKRDGGMGGGEKDGELEYIKEKK